VYDVVNGKFIIPTGLHFPPHSTNSISACKFIIQAYDNRHIILVLSPKVKNKWSVAGRRMHVYPKIRFSRLNSHVYKTWTSEYNTFSNNVENK
jgi:hypothetical protein